VKGIKQGQNVPKGGKIDDITIIVAEAGIVYFE
jgi:hypothetical protein